MQWEGLERRAWHRQACERGNHVHIRMLTRCNEHDAPVMSGGLQRGRALRGGLRPKRRCAASQVHCREMDHRSWAVGLTTQPGRSPDVDLHRPEEARRGEARAVEEPMESTRASCMA
jgi:hypothetical protein